MCVAAHRWMKIIELLYCWNLSKCVYGVAAVAATGDGAESVCALLPNKYALMCAYVIEREEKRHTQVAKLMHSPLVVTVAFSIN